MRLTIAIKSRFTVLQATFHTHKISESPFFEPLPDMHDNHRTTKRLIDYIEKRVLRETFTRIAVDVGLSEWTIRSIFSEFSARKQKEYHPTTPRFLGIDEAHLFHHYRCVLTDVEKRTVIDLLENRSGAFVTNYLRNMPDKDQIEIVCMDMWQPYRDAVKTILLDAKIVIDKFHVVRYASEALEAARKELRKTLPAKQRKLLIHDRFALLKRPKSLSAHERLVLGYWLTYPTMKQVYDLKEGFYDIFDKSPDRQTAGQAYSAWLNNLTPAIQPYFEPLTKAVENWHEEIFSYFDLLPNPITNAYTEQLNGLIKLINRNGRGYTFDVLRAKILFSEGVRKVIMPKFNRHVNDLNKIGYMLISEAVSDYQIRDHGADIYTLCQKILNGSFFPDQQ